MLTDPNSRELARAQMIGHCSPADTIGPQSPTGFSSFVHDSPCIHCHHVSSPTMTHNQTAVTVTLDSQPLQLSCSNALRSSQCRQPHHGPVLDSSTARMRKLISACIILNMDCELLQFQDLVWIARSVLSLSLCAVTPVSTIHTGISALIEHARNELRAGSTKA